MSLIAPVGSPEQMAGKRPRSRAKKACKSCNARRVRCNVMEEQPCANCRNSSVSCELMKSRRGKYERAPGKRLKVKGQQIPHCSPSASAQSSTQETTPRAEMLEAGSDREAVYDAAGTLASMPDPTRLLEKSQSYASPFGRSPHSIESPAAASDTIHAADSTVFLGESSSISLVHTQDHSTVNHTSPTDRTRLRYPIPDAVTSKTTMTPFEARRKTARIEYLTNDGAFTFPSNEICEVLLEAYFSWFHPCFPVLDKYTFYKSYITKTISPLLFHAVLFVGATHCTDSIMKELGYSDRQETRNTMYNHAKDIYDADCEPDKITVCQAVFLMSFWRAGPLLEKDTRHWLGAAISLAQTKGMHRSSSENFSDGKLRKRIWWSIYVRDRQCCAALGQPIRTRDEDCDLAMLEPSDFEESVASEYPRFLGTQKPEHNLYAIEMAKLAVYLGKIVLREFAPSNLPKSDLQQSRLKEDLATWESELSPEMAASATGDSFWASMLHLAYNNLHILLYRSAYIASDKTSGIDDLGNIALQAACRNTRIIEDVLSQDLVKHSNVHVTTSLFNSLCIHTICLQRSKSTSRKLAEYRAQLCLLGLRDVQRTWDVTNWVLQLFFQFLDQSTARRLQLNNENDDNPRPPSETPRSGSAEAPGNSQYERIRTQELSQGYGMGMLEDTPGHGLDFGTELFGTKEAEDFSMFQLQPDLFSGDVFGGGLEQYYNSVLTRIEPNGDQGLNNYRQ